MLSRGTRFFEKQTCHASPLNSYLAWCVAFDLGTIRAARQTAARPLPRKRFAVPSRQPGKEPRRTESSRTFCFRLWDLTSLIVGVLQKQDRLIRGPALSVETGLLRS